MRRRAIALLAIPAIITALACSANSNDSNDTQGPGAQPPSQTAAANHVIVLEVTGPAAADITYGTNADQSQENGAKLPWRKEITASEVPFATTLLAQSKGTGEIVCKITIDGNLKKENKSSGQFAVVTCTS